MQILNINDSVDRPTIERRKSPRLQLYRRVHVRDTNEWLMMQDIGQGGMLVTASTPKWPGTHLPLRFVLPCEERAIRVTCRVVSLVPTPQGVGLGLQFLRLAPEARAALAACITDRSTL